jgi:tetratricopeptide (TPR) repeat protein
VRRLLLGAVLLAACAPPLRAAGEIDVLERAVAADPENLQQAAAYRTLAVASGDFDRSIRLLESLAKRKGAGPNLHVSLALAYVDKVPTSGDIRRLYLGRDAIGELTKAIASKPTVLEYYLRGLINLYYNAFIFHRVPNGIADLEKARSMVTSQTSPALVARVYTSLGDGHFKIDELQAAREVWTAGLTVCPGDAGLTSRLAASGPVLKDIVTTAMYAGRRVDTSLAGIDPDR